MNDFVASSPRLACRVVRRWHAWFAGDDGSPLTRSHVARCADCQKYFLQVDALESALRREAAQITAPVPDGLESRVGATLARLAAVPHRRRPFVALGAVGAVAAILVLTMVLLPRAPVPRAVTASSGASGSDHLDWISSLGQQLGTVPPAADRLMQREPLQQEMKAVYSDADWAVRFLEANFTLIPPPPNQREG